MIPAMGRALARIARGVGAAVRARPGGVLAVAGLVLALDVLLPPVVLALVRAPWTFATVNPWLKRLPEYLASDRPLGEKLDFLTRVALFWVTADGPYGAPEWGFAVDTLDLLRFVAFAAVVALYFALWRQARAPGGPVARAGGAVGALAGALGLTTGPCSVVGCGAPVLPVVGLVFTGLSSETLALLSGLSRASVWVVLGGLIAGCGYLAWRVGERAPTTAARSPAPPLAAVPPGRGPAGRTT
jgi:hypothetical protein